jgi:hypothetical protein
MTQAQDDITTMFETALGALDQNKSVWEGRAAFLDAVTRAKDGTATIRNTIGKQQTPTTGLTEDKEASRADLEDRLIGLAAQLSAYAAKSGDHHLGAQVEMTRSSLDRLSESDLLQTAKRVADTGTDNFAALADYGVTKAELQALNDARTKFQDIKGSPRDAVVGRKVATMSLPAAIVSVRSIFRNEIDKMIIPFRATDPDFYNAYSTARIIVNRAAKRPVPARPAPPAPAGPTPGPSPAPSPAPK